jgi:hypothetical protein
MMRWITCLVSGVAVAAAAAPAEPAPFVNTWLVAGPFAAAAAEAGFRQDWIGEATAAPTPDQVWRAFDDRLFSRNYDDYQDLFSYFRIIRGESVAGVVAYAHVWVHSAAGQAAELRLGADALARAWINGTEVLDGAAECVYRDQIVAPIRLRAGWNRVLLKIANRQEGRLGFYARLCDLQGQRLPGLTLSRGGPAGPLAVTAARTLPTAWREWPYAAALPAAEVTPDLRGFFERKPHLALHASPFVLDAQGGTPPYRWSLVRGLLPAGLALQEDGTILGTVSAECALAEQAIVLQVSDQAGATATAELRLEVRERPSRWYEQARLVALLHNPESMLEASAEDLAEFARLMKRQGYGLGMMISYNNGDMKYRWPSRFEPDNPLGDLAGRYQQALEAAGVRFGMYMGNLIGPNHGGEQGAMLMVEEAVRRYRPAALWFDWASADPDGYAHLDALYSLIRTLSPETLIVLNGVSTLYQGDWDVICLEGWGAWGERMWSLWPFPLTWPKLPVVESWRLVADPGFDYTKDIQPDWQEYLRLQVSLIGEGFVANIDHSPTIRTPFRRLYESPVMQAHRAMAEWANPADGVPLHEAYTQVDPGPLADAPWGYNTISVGRDRIYLHLLANARGKTGKPDTPRLTVGPLGQQVVAVRWLNRNQALPFHQRGGEVTLEIAGLVADPIDTILRLELAGPHPVVAPPTARAVPIPPGNLAFGRPARLLSTDGQRDLVPSGFAFARFGVDGVLATHAQGAYEWAWMFHVDLEAACRLRQIVVHFLPRGYATEYRLLVSADGQDWQTVAHVREAQGGRHEHALDGTLTRYIRVQAIKPDGPDQVGAQMAIGELEAYALP